MKRASAVAAGILILLAGLSLGYPLDRTSAMNVSEGGDTNNTCANTYPAPYTGGAGTAKSFHTSDGSTVTVTTTGAVIKQTRCGTPYREGWINTSEICNVQSAQDLSGRVNSGSSNPDGSTGFTGCPSKTQVTARQSSSVTIINNNSQSQSQSNNGSGTHTAASTVSKSSNVTSSAQAQVQAAHTTASPAVRTLPNTGPGNVLGFSGLTVVFGTIGHYLYNRRRSLRI